MRVYACDHDQTSECDVFVDTEASGNFERVAINGDYLLNTCAACPGEDLEIEVTHSNRPLKFLCPSHPEWLAVLMPMTL